MTDMVNHPPHYTSGKYEVLDVIEDWFPDNYLRAQVLRYIARAGKKFDELEDLKKAKFYLEREISKLEDPKPYTETMEVAGYHPEEEDDDFFDLDEDEYELPQVYSWKYLNDDCIPPGVYTVVDKAGDLWDRGSATCHWQRLKDGASPSRIASTLTSPLRAATELEKKHGRTARVWESLDDIPSDVYAFSAGGCRWHQGMWSSKHAKDNGYRYDDTAPFTEVLS